MAYEDFEDSRMYQRAEAIADAVWNVTIEWEPFAKGTIGMQLARAADSIGANIAESNGRYHPNDVIRFLHYARGSLRETRYWLKRALSRKLIQSAMYDKSMNDLNQLAAEINGYINYQRTRTVKDPSIDYNADEKSTSQQSN